MGFHRTVLWLKRAARFFFIVVIPWKYFWPFSECFIINNNKLSFIFICYNIYIFIWSHTVKVKGVTYKVTAVSDKAFKDNKKLTTVTIGSNVTKIGKEAFASCKNLKKITVTAGKLKTISKNAFKGVNKKVSITVKGTKKAKTALKKQLKKKSIGYVKTWKIK